MNEVKKRTRAYEIDHAERKERRSTPRRVERDRVIIGSSERHEQKEIYETSIERAESRQLVAEMAQSFADSIAFYESPQ